MAWSLLNSTCNGQATLYLFPKCLLCWEGKDTFLLSEMSKLALGHTQPPSRWVLGVQQLRLDAEHSPPSSVKVNNEWSYTLQHLICLHGMYREKSTFIHWSTHRPCFMPVCFMPFCFNSHCQFTPVLNLCPLIFSLTPFGWLTPYFWWE